MKKIISVVICMVIVLAAHICIAEQIVVMDEYELLTQQEIDDGVQLDPDTLFAYKILDDDTVIIVRYCWYHTKVDIPEQIAGKRVSEIGAYAFDETGVQDIFLSHEDIVIDECAFEYTNATVWIPTGHPTLRIITGLIRIDDSSVDYCISAENGAEYRYYTEID